MRITRKVFSEYSEINDIISAIEERAFNEGYMAAQKEFAEEEEDKDRKRKIGKVLTGAGIVGGVAGTAKTLVDIDEDETHFKNRIEDLKTEYKGHYNKRVDEARKAAQDLKDSASSKHKESLANWTRETINPTGVDLDDHIGKSKEKLDKINKRYVDTLKGIDSDYRKEVKGIEEKFGKEVVDGKVEKLKGEAAASKGKIIKSAALKYGLPALAVTGVGAGLMYKNRKKKD